MTDFDDFDFGARKPFAGRAENVTPRHEHTALTTGIRQPPSPDNRRTIDCPETAAGQKSSSG